MQRLFFNQNCVCENKFGVIQSDAGMQAVHALYSGYGELNETDVCPTGHSKHGAPCAGPKVLRMVDGGNAYLEADFPRMDYTRTARIAARSGLRAPPGTALGPRR